MKKIGIITIQKCDNFGADLQAYALGAKLRSLGHDAENIDYLFYKHPRHRGGWGEKPIFKLSLVNRAKELLFPVVDGLKNLKRRKAIAARHERFKAWTDKHLKCGPEYRSVSALYQNPPQYDVYMVGSDQVWNPRMGSNILPYFMDFAPAGACKVSYASSLGVSELPTPAFLKYRELLKDFSHVGLREARGAELVGRMKLEAEVKHVLDPTLLLSSEEWARVADEPKTAHASSRYLLLYDLIASSETVALARRIAARKGLEVIRVGDGAYGPGEFVWLFAHADCVVTNSFHGTAFSLIHEKDFVSVIPRGMTNASRIESVLKVVGLDSQIVRAESASAMDAIPPIDWTSVHVKLDAARAESVDFLERAVSGEKRTAPRKAIGNLPRASYAVWNPDAAIRAESTSGGAFTWLAEATIRNGGIVYGAAFEADFKHVRHVAAETLEDLAPIRKSKYVYSDATTAIKDAVSQLKTGRHVLFTGCPCQCAAMKAAAKDCAEKLLTLDFVCHGTPRPEVFAAYVDELEKRYGAKLTRYEFRNKDKGWNFHNVCYEFSNGIKRRLIAKLDPYYMGFFVGASMRSSCFTCPYATLERVSDVTIADCWRVATSYPEWDDNRGTSLVFASTEKGEQYLTECGISNLPGGAYPVDQAEKRNAALVLPATRPRCYEQFHAALARTGSFAQASSIFMTCSQNVKTRLVYWIKRCGWRYFKHHQ